MVRLTSFFEVEAMRRYDIDGIESIRERARIFSTI